MIVKLTADISCQQPPWVSTHTKLGNRAFMSNYRIYIDDELLAERTWVWDNNTFISEQIFVETESNILKFRLEPVQTLTELGEYSVNNVHVNDNLISGQGLDFQVTLA